MTRRNGRFKLFHDTDSALQSSWQSDRSVLEASGFEVNVLRQLPTFVEARVAKQGEVVLVQWARAARLSRLGGLQQGPGLQPQGHHRGSCA